MSNNYAYGVKSAIAARDKYLQKIKWKDYELNIIKNNYKKMSDREIQQAFLSHRSLRSVTSKRQEMGCHKHMQKHQVWTPEEIKLLKENYLKYDQRQLQAKFFPNKTIAQVNGAKMHRGLKKPPVWTNEERAILIENGANYTHRDLQSKFFPDKTLSQISSMRKHLCVRRSVCVMNGK